MTGRDHSMRFALVLIACAVTVGENDPRSLMFGKDV